MGRLTNAHLDTINGRRDRLHGQIQKSFDIVMQVQAREKRSEHPFNEASRRIIRNAAMQISRWALGNNLAIAKVLGSCRT